MTNDFFTSRRFRAYFRKLLTEHWRTICVATAILLGIMLVAEIWTALSSYSYYFSLENPESNYDPARETLFFTGALIFLVGGCILLLPIVHRRAAESRAHPCAHNARQPI